jgi:hypothetical protein
MATYPETIRVGIRPVQATYELQPDQLLIRFGADVNDDRIERVLGRSGLKLRHDRLIDRSDAALRVGRMRWVDTDRLVRSSEATSEIRQVAEGAIDWIAPVYYIQGQGAESAASPLPDALVVKLRDENDKKAQRLVQQGGLDRNPVMSDLLRPFSYYTVKPDVDQIHEMNRIAEIPGVEIVEFDWLKLETYQLVPSDTFWANQWDQARIGLVGAWDVQTGTANTWIADIDSGFDLAHPDLRFTPDVAPNFTHFNADQAIAGAPPPYDAGPSGVSHGMGTAGIAAAIVDNGAGVAGVAGGCSIMPVRLGTVPSADRVAAGINWAATRGAKVANLSLNTTATAAATTAVTSAWAAGMVLCAATGNNAGNTTSPAIGFPANHPNAIAVGASDQNDQRKRPASADLECWGSHFGAEIDVIAPGVRCWTTDEQGAAGNNSNAGGAIAGPCVSYPSSGDAAGNYFAIFNGTSAATPHVAGFAALLFSQYATLTNQQVRDIIERTADKVSPALYAYANDPAHPNGTWHTEVGYGRINCNAGLRYADLVIADHDLDVGDVPSTTLVGGVWTPRIFWGYQPYVTITSQPAATPTAHEPAVAGQDNYVHAQITNRGPATSDAGQVSWHILDYPGTELIWPTDWNAGNRIATASIGPIAPGATIQVEAVWPQALVDIASAYVHPCMMVQVAIGADIGGQLGNRVYLYNNIAQHNISFAAMSKTTAEAFTLPFAVGHADTPVRMIDLLFNLRSAEGATVRVDTNPDRSLPYVDRIRRAGVDRHDRSCCELELLDDARFLVLCGGATAEVDLRRGSTIRSVGHSGSGLDLDGIELRNARPSVKAGQFELTGPEASLRFPLAAGQIVPVAVAIEPLDRSAGRTYRVDVTQVSEGVATGGVTLEVRP